MGIVSFEELWVEIKKAYDPTFIEELMELPGAHVYVFGGMVTDLSLGKPWKDLDIRVIWDVSKERQKQDVGGVLARYTHLIQQMEFPGGLVFRVRQSAGKDMVIDVGVANNFEKFRADFTASAIFVDLKTGEIVDLGRTGVDDFRNKTVKTVDDPNSLLDSGARYVFRALKFAAKTGFSIDRDLEKVLRSRKDLAQNAVKDIISHLKGNGKDSVSEWLLSSMFGGLKSDAVEYVALLEQYGFLQEMCIALRDICGDKQDIEVGNYADLFKNKPSFEDKLSLFLSIIAKAISNSPAQCFESLKKLFAFDTSRSDGNEFPVDPAQMIFVP